MYNKLATLIFKELKKDPEYNETQKGIDTDKYKCLPLLFEAFKGSTYYEQIELDIDYSWLADKLNSEDIEKVERQSISLLIDNEQGVFNGCLKFIIKLINELTD